MSLSPSIKEDFLLIEQIRENNTTAFNSLFNKYWQLAFGAAYKRLQNKEDAQDIVQEIFLQIWNNRDKLNIENFPAYLHVSVRNRVIKLAAKRKYDSPFSTHLIELIRNPAAVDDQLLYKEFFKAYEAFIATLPPQRQTIFKLRHQQELNTKEISQKLGISRKSVQNQLGKANDALRISLSKGNLVVLLMLLFR